VALRRSFDAIRRTELDRIAPVLAGLAPEQRQAIEAMTSTMVNKLLHTPMLRIKKLLAQAEDDRLTAAMVTPTAIRHAPKQ
jgi:glutamyl-tRNA reductase